MPKLPSKTLPSNPKIAQAAKHILIIKQGALGDIILATAAIKAIREYHPNARIHCLTRASYVELLSKCPWIDTVIIDTKPKLHERGKLRTLEASLNTVRFDMVYDLQNATRSSLYWWLFSKPRPRFCGAAYFASDRFVIKDKSAFHAYDLLAKQLTSQGITKMGLPDISWLTADISHVLPEGKFILMAPGGAPHRLEKRWPAEHYAAIANALYEKEAIRSLLIGTKDEAKEIETIQSLAPHSISLMGQTSIAELASLSAHAYAAIGNDTGPMHIISAAARIPAFVLFSHASSPERSAPVGSHVASLQEKNLHDLTPETVLDGFKAHVNRYYTEQNTALMLDIAG